MALLDSLSLGLRKKLPVILQTENAECGLACIAMILGYFGTLTDLSTLRQQHPMSLKGITLAALCKLAGREQLGYRAVRLEVSELSNLRMPAILHWDLNHFVVFKGIEAGKVVIHDPAYGLRKVSIQEASKKFTGVALELWPNPDFVAKVDKQRISISQLIGQVKGLWTPLSYVLLITFALEVISLTNPLFMQWTIDQVLISKDSDLLFTLSIGFLILIVLEEVFDLFRSWILLTINTSVTVQWQSNIFSHLLKLPINYFESRHLGDLVSRTDASKHIQSILSTTLVATLFDGVFAVVALGMMLLYSVHLSAIALVAIILYILVRFIWYTPFYNATEEHIVRSALLSTHFLESLRGARAIKIFGRQHERLTTWQSLLVNETNAKLSISKLQIFYSLARTLLSGGFNILIIYTGAKIIMADQLSVGMLIAFLAYRSQFNTRVTQLVNSFVDLKMLKIQAERLADILLTPTESDEVRNTNTKSRQEIPEIRFDNLEYRYAESEPLVLNGVSFTVRPGESIAIVGSSGCGKSTLVNLLLGTYKPSKGNIYIGKLTLEQFGYHQWREMLGVVMQDDSLFSGSIASNISFFERSPDFTRIENSAKLAAIHHDIEAMPMGYQTLVGDMGTVLSGGQKQRVLMARALYKKPKILILDEATSHLDLMREALVNLSIASLKMTRIIIAHRPDTIKRVDRVLEMQNGNIIFDGSPKDYFSRINYAFES